MWTFHEKTPSRVSVVHQSENNMTYKEMVEMRSDLRYSDQYPVCMPIADGDCECGVCSNQSMSC